MDTFAEALRKARAGAGLSQQKLAKAIGVSRTMVALYESDTNPSVPPRDRVLSIATALELTPLATDRLLKAAGYGPQYAVDPGELAGVVQIEEAYVQHLVVEHLDLKSSPASTAPASLPDFRCDAPPLPPHFVPRPEVSQALKEQLLADDPLHPGVLVVSAIHGMGGVGKSTLAAALAHDAEIEQRFPDGILWITLYQQLNPLAALSTWIQALGDYTFRPINVEAASAHLRTLLRDKTSLLVVDDAWDVAQARAFLVGGSRCKVLFTTREALIAKAIGASLYTLDVMTPAQSLELLETRLGRNLVGVEKEQATTLSSVVGFLPLALELAAAQVADGFSWGELLVDLQAEIARLEDLEVVGASDVVDEREHKRLSLLGSFQLSLKHLPSDKYHAFVWIGVLPEGVYLTPMMMATLWETEVRLARENLRFLRDKALLLPGIPLADGSLTYRVHDLLHNLARRLLVTSPNPARVGDLYGLGLPLSQAHALVLNRYRRQTKNNLWYTLPDDDYIYAHLTWHMEQAGQVDEIHALLSEENTEAQNAWYQACEQIGQTAVYLADVERAWRLADQAGTSSETAYAVGLQVRYALIVASVNSRAKNIPPDLLIALIKQGIWPPIQGLTYVLRVPDIRLRIEILAKLSLQLVEQGAIKEVLVIAEALHRMETQHVYRSGSRQACVDLAVRLAERGYPQEALVVARMLQGTIDQIKVLAKLRTHLADSDWQATLAEALIKVRSAWEGHQPEDLVKLLPYIKSEEQPTIAAEALAKMDKVRNDKSQILAQIALYLPEAEQESVLTQALEAAFGEINWTYGSAERLKELAPRLTESLLYKAIADAHRLPETFNNIHDDDVDIRGPALVALLPRLAELGHVDKALAMIPGGSPKADALADLVHYLPVAFLRSAIAKVPKGWYRSDSWTRALVVLAPRLAEQGYPEEALGVAQEIDDTKYQVKTLIGIIPYLSEQLLAKVLNEAKPMTLVKVAPHLPEPVKSRALTKTLMEARATKDKNLLVETALHFPDQERRSVLVEALKATQELNDAYARVNALTAMAPHLSEELLAEVISSIEKISKEGRKANPREALAFEITPFQAYTWAGVQAADALIEIAPYMPETLLRHVLVSARTLGNNTDYEHAMTGILPQLARLGHLDEAIELSRSIEHFPARYLSISNLLPYIVDPIHLREAMEVILKQDRHAMWKPNNDAQMNTFRRMVLKLELPMLYEALEMIYTVKDSDNRVDMLIELIPRFPEEDRPDIIAKALEEAWKQASYRYGDDENTAALEKLSPYLTEALLRDTLEKVQQVEGKVKRENILAILIPHLARFGYTEEALAAARKLKFDESDSVALARMVQYLPEEAKTQVADEVLRRCYHTKDLVALVLTPHLPQSLILDAFGRLRSEPTVISKENEKVRNKARILLAARLAELGNGTEAVELALSAEKENIQAVWSAMAPYLSETTLRKALEQIKSMWNEIDQTRTLMGLAPSLANLPVNILYPAWQDMLRFLSIHSRESLLLNLRMLAPVIAALGGQEAAVESARSILEVGRWWS
jgi:transcriptional regulator with XRE-family HTH domain